MCICSDSSKYAAVNCLSGKCCHCQVVMVTMQQHLIQSNAFESNASSNANADESNASANAAITGE